MGVLRLGLIGYPLGHSLSPLLHEAALSALGIAGSYSLFPVPPGEAGEKLLSALCADLRAKKLDGLNVTIPHKRSLDKFIDAWTPTAQAVGAVNTLYVQNEQLWADNTDAPGFIQDLTQQAGWPAAMPMHNQQPVAWVLGAGGSSRAVSYSLVRAGWFVVVFARRLAQAQELVEALSEFVDIRLMKAQELSSVGLSKAPGEPDLVVNTTPVGMYPDVHSSPWPLEANLPKKAFMYDLVYNPPATVLVQSARRAGNRACNGLGMLVEQAALSLERWTGRQTPRQVMWKAVQSISSQVSLG